MAARVAAEQQDDGSTAAPPARGASRPAQERATVDPHLVTKLAAEGWVEHTQEKG